MSFLPHQSVWLFVIGIFAILYSPVSLSRATDKQIYHQIDQFFTPSTLSRQQQFKELKWFSEAARPFEGMTLYVVSERIDTHEYEAVTLSRAFFELTGIKVIHELTGEDDLLRKLVAQSETGVNIYDAYINDSDLIGTHYRSDEVVVLSDFIEGEGREVTLPTLDLEDFIGLSFTTAPDGKIYQLPDQQFANLYWFRYDWFSRKDLRERFKAIYGYELGVPLNWSAYEDIAEFFTVHVRQLDGKQVWGHMDYGKKDPSLGWRISDAWLSMAGMGDAGLPNGLPVDDWGIRVNGCRPVGASVARGGALDGPAAIYAINKFADWFKFAPPEARYLNFTDAGRWVSSGQIAQQIFWYTAFVAQASQPGLPVVNEDGTPKWRVAPSPLGVYWEEGMKSGYQDAGSWTLLKSTPLERRKAAWLYAQFTVSKTVSLKKTIEGLTPIRKSDLFSEEMTRRAPQYGGLVEFYRSRGRDVWTPTGTNVPDYPRLSPLWWQHVSKAVTGELKVDVVMSNLAAAMDKQLEEIGLSSDSPCAPKLNLEIDPDIWINRPGAPKPERNERPPGKTLSYEEAIKAWH
ncbi:ABC transporter substrate-binding protein [Hahella ganghwensis]|uniref:ABC transporter substrate-binding protein n=1 Tax=Hahella ganghwensis TaxID=286420 RepID=UPI0005240A85|nr:ABC transporter substrate-binding protein [Hahella ganghwensis]